MTQGVRARISEFGRRRGLAVLAITALVAGTAAAAPVRTSGGLSLRGHSLKTAVERAVTNVAERREPLRLAWEGEDVDGDGNADFANPTGRQVREHDAYGSGRFGASRDGGARSHQGVDFTARAGQSIVAPISGYVSRIGFAYVGDEDLRYVEILNPALGYAARVFYVDPEVEIGDAVAVGRPIGRAASLQRRYPGGMTDHVHLEVMEAGRRIDASDVIVAEYVRGGRPHAAD